MPSLRKRVSSYFRQLSFYNEPREKKNNINENSFVTRYLEGHISIKEGPPILYGKNPTDLPNYDLGNYDMGPTSVTGCYSGPNGGLTTVKRLEKHLSIPDTDIDFIDTQDEAEEVPVNPSPVLQKSPQNRQTVDNSTMLIKVAGQEYLVTNRKKPENKSHSLDSLSDFEIEKTKICTELYDNNNSENVKCKNQELANTQSDNQISSNSNKSENHKIHTENQKSTDTNSKKSGPKGTQSRRKSKILDAADASKSHGLAKSKSEGNPFQHKKKGKIIRISSRPTAHVDNVSTGSDYVQTTVDPALPEDWNRKSDYVFGISDSLYDRNQVTKCKNGDPIADCFGIIARNDSAILAVADGVNWGEKACIAAKSAVHGCLHYLDKTIFNDTKPFDDLTITKTDPTAPKSAPIFSQNRIGNTRDIFVCLLRAFNCAHDLILENEGMLTTLTVAIILPLKAKNVKNVKPKEKSDSLNRDRPRRSQPERHSGRNIRTSFRESNDETSDSYVCCVCNVGDTLAYVYSQKYGVRELTKGSHDVNCNRDMRDALGALGPVDGINPELSNLTLSVTVVQKGDIIMVASDGLTDNFDPNVCKFTVNSKDVRPKRPSTSKESHHNKENVSVEAVEKPRAEEEVPISKPEVAEAELDDKGAKVPIKPPRKNRDSVSRSSRERSVDSLEGTLETNQKDGAKKSSTSETPASLTHDSGSQPTNTSENAHKAGSSDLTKPTSKRSSDSSEPVRKKSTASNEQPNDLDNPLVAQFMRENSLNDQPNTEKAKPSLDRTDAKHKTTATKKPPTTRQNVHVHKTASRHIPLNKSTDLKRSSSKVRDLPAKSNMTGFLRSKTSIDMRTSAKTILRNDEGVPYVTPLQRYEISLLLMEDVLKHGISGHDSLCACAKTVCENLVNFTFSISSAKRHTLEDTDLYFDNVNGVLVEVSQQEKKGRRRKGLERVQNLPGKLDHVSIVAYNVGNFAYTY